ncbi:unnamed protein product [Bursaphelenchus xylophilus]|uniref:(pine wood nematode) hypothetical protein n=1 Tax=Bursaphelenchus xylophilus TaxID=6326 RepID=A0A1I7RTQ7_BURXY|nr:unnamed protein product [Bursaphelenchus xylophilus]CAG9122212.1 unnamed protein product [Bursaphelenchus xylophilus]
MGSMLAATRDRSELQLRSPNFQLPGNRWVKNSKRKETLRKSSKSVFVHHYVNALKQEKNKFWRPWLINRSFLSAFTESEASSLFIRLHSTSFEISNGFKSLSVLQFRSGDLQRLENYLSFFSPNQNVDFEFDGFLMDPMVAKQCGNVVKEFFALVPTEKFIHLNIHGTLQGYDPDTHSRLSKAFLDGLRGNTDLMNRIDLSCDSRCLQHLSDISVHKLRVEDYGEEANYCNIFRSLKAEIISIPNFPLDIFEDISHEPNEDVKEIVCQLTTGHDKEYYETLLITLSAAFPRLCEFKLEATFSTVDNPDHFEILEEMATDCEILSTLEATFRIMGNIRFYYSDKHECKNYDILNKHGFDKRRKGRSEYMICTGSNVFKLSMWNMV